MAGRLGIHVIGPRFGESIILELPDGGVGVIDSFAARRGHHPVVGFLEKRWPGLKELRFFAITHPHADHCFRAADVLDRYSAEEAWIFRPFPAGHVQDYYRAMRRHGSRDRIEAALELPVGSMAQSILQLDDRITTARRRKTFRFRYLSCGAPFRLCGGAVHFHFLTPGDQAQLRYASQTREAAQAIFADGPTLRAAGELPEPQHNLASGALLLAYGGTRVLLMADAEQPLWRECLDGGHSELRLPVHFLKAAHHGSDNGYHDALFTAASDPDLTIAVVTPFNAGSVSLPTRSGIQALRLRVKDLYCTNRTSAETSTGLSWAPVAPLLLPGLPSTWAREIRRKPALARLVVPEVGLAAPGGVDPPLPRKWIEDAHRDPTLWRLIRPAFRRPLATAPAAEPHSISVFFDDKGTLLDQQAGAETGRLP